LTSISTISLNQGISLWLSATQTPTKQDVALLRSASSQFYGANRNLNVALDLLSKIISVWTSKQQPDDEVAGLYRVRADCYMLMGDAQQAAADYNQAVTLLQTPIGKANADPTELPTALLGRARANKSLAVTTASTANTVDKSRTFASQAAADYKQALILSSREDWDTPDEYVLDGAVRNPFAAWEWGSALRLSMNWEQAAQAHNLAAQAFDEIGDKARAVISYTDAGIDFAAAAAASKSNNKELVEQAESVLRKAMIQTKGVKSNDIPLLQRVIAKEGEGRMALAATLWSDGQKQEAETVLGDGCLRMDQLQA
jgi:tetratricopeptide (TPR) repeat protein